MQRRPLVWIALLSVLILSAFLAAWKGGFTPGISGGVEPDERAANTRIETLRALISAPAGDDDARSSAIRASVPSASVDSVQCLVLDDEGKPRAGVPVFLLRPSDELESELERIDPEQSSFAIERPTADDGRVEFRFASRERLYVLALVESESLIARAWVRDAREITLRFPPTIGAFEIEVVTQAGVPVPEYSLTLHRERGSTLGSIGEHAVRSPDGRFATSIERALAPHERLVVGIRPSIEFDPAHARYSLDDLSAGTVHRIVVTEDVAGRLRGVVVHRGGEPLVGATVTWTSTRDSTDGVSERTDASGAFVLGALAVAGRGYLSAESFGLAPYLRPLTEVPVSAAGELWIEVEAGGVVEGRVTSGGMPVPKARVVAWVASARPESFGRLPDWRAGATTDAEGRYRLDHVPQGTLLVGVVAPTPSARRECLTNVHGLEVYDVSQVHDITLTTGVRVRGEFDADFSDDAALFLQIIASADAQTPSSTATCTAGESFELEVPRSRASMLRIWLNAGARIDVPIPASGEPIDLGEIELQKKAFRPPDARGSR